MNFEYEFTQSSWTAIDGLIRKFEKNGIFYDNMCGESRKSDNMKSIPLKMLHTLGYVYLFLRRFTYW
jgi:hypothetical protein